MISPAVPVPVNVGVLSLVELPAVIGPMTGATSSVAFGAIVGVSGAMVSTVKSIAGLLPLSFPAASLTV